MSILYNARVHQALTKRELKNRHTVAINTGISWHRISKIENSESIDDATIAEILLLNNLYGDNVLIDFVIEFLKGIKHE